MNTVFQLDQLALANKVKDFFFKEQDSFLKAEDKKEKIEADLSANRQQQDAIAP